MAHLHREKHRNLKQPWKAGCSGNPKGRPRGAASLTSALKRSLSREDCDAIAEKLIAMARKGEIAAIKLLLERLDDLNLERRLAALEKRLMPGNNGNGFTYERSSN